MLKTCSCITSPITSPAKDNKANREIKNLIISIVLYKLELSSKETYQQLNYIMNNTMGALSCIGN